MEEIRMEQIEVKSYWCADSVRRTCIEQNWYTAGDNEAYSNMLDMVDSLEPTTGNILIIAKDIYEHSDDQTISNIMYGLKKDAIDTFFTINGNEF